MNKLNQEIGLTQTYRESYKCLSYLIAIYTFLFILPSLLLRKMVDVPYFGVIPVSILFTGIYFMLLDVVTEVYGAREAKKVLISALIAYTLFVFIMHAIISIPSPDNYKVMWSSVQDEHAYEYLFNNLYLVWISVVICALFANNFNIIILSRWKVLLNGRFFWLRSVCTSFFAALFYSLVTNLFSFGFFMGASKMPYFLELVFVSVFAKLLTLIIFAYPASLLSLYLKHKEKVDIYDSKINYNPFEK